MPSMRTDAELIASYAASQDEGAFAELVSRYRQLVHRTCLRLLGDNHAAEDATQATFIVLVKRAASLRREGNLAGWLHKVARLVALETLRARARRAKREQEAAMMMETERHGDEEACWTDVLQALDRELAALSGLQRQAVQRAASRWARRRWWACWSPRRMRRYPKRSFLPSCPLRKLPWLAPRPERAQLEERRWHWRIRRFRRCSGPR